MSQKFRPKEPVEASGIDVAKRIWTHWACGDYFWVLGTKYWVFGTRFGIWYLIWYLVPHPILGLWYRGIGTMRPNFDTCPRGAIFMEVDISLKSIPYGG